MEQKYKEFVRSMMSFMGHSEVFPEDRTGIHFDKSHLTQPNVTGHFHHRPAMEPTRNMEAK